jgi:hypothetical protein
MKRHIESPDISILGTDYLLSEKTIYVTGNNLLFGIKYLEIIMAEEIGP